MNILITGANGFIGNHLVYALQKQGHQVTACIHNIKSFKINQHDIKIMECDFNQDTTPDKWLDRLTNIDIVINSVGIIKETITQKFKTLHQDTPIALFKACEIIGVKKIINISALGADSSAFSQFHLSKKIADDYLKTLNLDWIIIMPSIVYGAGAKSMAFFKAMAALPVTPLLSKGDQVIQPININDFCSAVNQLILFKQPNRFKIAFVGPESITLLGLFILLKQWLNITSCHFIQIPYSIMLLFSKFTNLLSFSSISTDSIKMLKHGNIADVTPFINYFGFTPLSIEESLKQYPAQQADRWHSKLLFIQPLLKFSIAFVWIFTGITSVFIYQIELSYKLLDQIGINGVLAPIVLFGAAVMDIFLGLATLLSYRIKIIGLIQIVIILSYSLLISLYLPEQWVHPFGPITKNIPLIIATAIMIILYDRKWR